MASPKGHITVTVLLLLEMSMPTEFMVLPPIQICNWNLSCSRCRFNLLGDVNSYGSNLLKPNRYNKGAG